MSNREKLRAQMIENAAEINRLRHLNDDSVWNGQEPPDIGRSRSEVCNEFQTRVPQLCVPGGWDVDFLDRLKAGDYSTVEAALCFLEVRPYFFRSGYLWKDLLRKCKRVPMSDEQSSRLQALLKRYEEWKAERDEKSKRGMKVRNALSKLLLRFERLFPVFIPDSDLDGIDTVGKLYIALCHKLNLEPLQETSGSRGQARKPYSPARSLMFVRLNLSSSEAHCRSSWDAADVWATLAAAIRLTYSLNEGCPIHFDTELPIRLEK